MRSLPVSLALLALSVSLVSGCAESLHDVHVSDFTPGVDLTEAKSVEARTEQHTIMGFVYDTGYVDEARRHLIDQCPRGRLEGITTQYSTDLGFFSWTNRLLMKGYCVRA